MEYYQKEIDSVAGIALSQKDNDTKLGELLTIQSELFDKIPKHGLGELRGILGARNSIANMIDSLCALL